MKITNVSHYVSVAGKEACVDNLHFIIEGAKFEALACAGDSLALRHYKNWLKSAEVEKPTHNKQNTPCLECSEWRVNYPFITYCPNCGSKYE